MEVKKSQFECHHCNKIFVRKLHLEQHLANHERKTKFICDLCGKTFFHPSHLKSHKRYHLDKSKDVSCQHCNQNFKGKRSLNNHIKVIKYEVLQISNQELLNSSLKKSAVCEKLLSTSDI